MEEISSIAEKEVKAEKQNEEVSRHEGCRKKDKLVGNGSVVLGQSKHESSREMILNFNSSIFSMCWWGFGVLGFWGDVSLKNYECHEN